MGLELRPAFKDSDALDNTELKFPGLNLSEPPEKKEIKSGTTTKDFTNRKKPDYSKQDAANRKLGLMGEKLVVKSEIDFLSENGKQDLAEKVVHVAKVEGDGAGYDVRSYNLDGTIKYIEVKTTCGGINTAFFLSSNELAFSQQHIANYYLYRLYDYNKNSQSGNYYIVEGDIGKSLTLNATEYRAHL